MMEYSPVVTPMAKNYLISEDSEHILINTSYHEAIGSLYFTWQRL